ncbi:MAG: AAA family ATPase [Alphaproteobacteria bacterium]|nr:AAA family ATPase [Alphaproteobacteria bacterium]
MDGPKTTDLGKTLGFDRKISFLKERVLVDRAKRLVLRGPSGTGKSTLAKSVALAVEHAGYDVVWLRGDPGRTKECYHPLRLALEPSQMRRFASRGLRIVESLVEDLLPAGKTTAKTIMSLLPNSVIGTETSSIQNAEVPRELLARLTRAIKHRHVLLIADDLQYFDEDSLRFLSGLAAIQVGVSDLLDRVSMLSVVNDEILLEGKTQELVDTITGTLTAATLDRCDAHQFGDVLRCFGLGVPLPPDVTRLLYDCSQGHLHIAKFIADELRITKLKDLDAATFSDLLQYVIQRRLEKTPIEHERLANLLSSAAFIGRSFTQQELACLAGTDISDVRQALRLAESLRFVETEGDDVRFSHEIMRSYFFRYATAHKMQFSSKYSQCLRILRPADYFARSITLLDADDFPGAAVAYCQGMIADWRAGRTDERRLDDPSARRIHLRQIDQDYLFSMHQAHILLSKGDYRSACLILDALQGALDRPLLAERDYLRAEALLKDLGASSTREAARILGEWDDLRDVEPELWCRMKLLCLLAHVQLEEYSELKKTERQIIAFLSSRARFDRSAEHQLNRLLATSEMHSSAEIAQKRIHQACEYYERQFRENGTTDIYEYFICLTNRSGNGITNGLYHDAFAAGCEALALGREYPTIRFPAQWAAANNVVVAAVLDGRMLPDEGVECLRELLERYPEMDDDVLLHSNMASLAVLSGQLDLAFRHFDINARRFAETPDIDPYYFYLSEGNRAIALQRISAPSAKDVWDSCGILIPKLAPAIRHDLKRRHDAYAAMFMQDDGGVVPGPPDKPIALSPHMLRPERFPGGLFLTDIQIWSNF